VSWLFLAYPIEGSRTAPWDLPTGESSRVPGPFLQLPRIHLYRTRSFLHV